MKLSPTPVPGAFLVELEPVGDERGWFARSFCREQLERAGAGRFEVVQVNVAWNHTRGTLRGLHYQRPPHAERKLMRCSRGAAFVVLVDLRRESPAFAHPWSVTLRADRATQLLVPERVANGYQTLEDETEIHYLMSESYHPESAAGIRYDDPRLAIAWPLPPSAISERDRELPPFDPESSAL